MPRDCTDRRPNGVSLDEQSGPDRPDPIHDHHMQSKKISRPQKTNQRRGPAPPKPKNGNGNGNGRPKAAINNQGNLPVQVAPRSDRQQSVAAAYGSNQRTQPPQISASRDSCRIVHRELVAKLVGTVNFTVAQSLPLNPGMSSTFPWLSTQAAAWESYRFNRLRFCYFTRCSSATNGSVQLVPDYDAADPAPGSEIIASGYEDCQEAVAWKDFSCELRPQAMFPMGPKKFIRTSALSSNQDIKTYDAGNFFATTADGTSTAWGLLWVEYDVTLYTPQTPSAGFVAAEHITASVPTSAAMTPSGVVTSGSTPLLSAVPTAEVVTFAAAGRYMVIYNATATTSITETAVPIVAGGGSLVTTFGLGGTGIFSAGSGTTAFSSVVMVDALVGTTLTYNYTDVLGLLSELIVIRAPAAMV